ncbi:MAG: hypothetical protein ACJ76H_08025 [Bacteriovoracaceae bacterium]
MKRLRLLFAITLFLFFFPLWRAMDYQAITFPSATFYALSMAGVLFTTILLPIRLIYPAVKKLHLFLGLFTLTILFWLGSPLSGKATRHYELRHCGLATFTGFFWPVSSILPPAHQVDLEARNQMCWVRKMALRVPESIADVKELQNYLDLIRQKLLSPPVKYKSTLPLIAFLHGKMSASLEGPALESIELGKMFVDSLHFWKSQYTVEISALDFPWYAWPHSAYIKFEYGLIEKNWESLVDGLQIESK